MVVSGMFKICLFALAAESLLKIISNRSPTFVRDFSDTWGQKKVGSCPFRDDQLRVKAPGLIDSKQTVPDLAFLQERPADELAQALLQTWPGRGRYTKANLVEATNIQQRGQIPAAEPVFVRQGYVERRIGTRSLHTWRAQHYHAARLKCPVQRVNYPKQRVLGDMLNHMRRVDKIVRLGLVRQKAADIAPDFGQPYGVWRPRFYIGFVFDAKIGTEEI